MWTLSGFSDEISDDVTEQCAVATTLGLHQLEIRSAWGTNILDLDRDRLELLRRTLVDHGLGVSSIGSPIGKVGIQEAFPAHLDRMRHAVEVAHLLGAPFIRVFSFFVPPGEDPHRHREQVLARMAALTEVAREGDVVLLHENEKAIYGDVPRRCLDVAASIDSPHLRLAWDPANFVQCGVRPFTEGYALLRPYLAYIQVKDALAGDGTVVVAGAGDGEVAATLRALHDDGFDGFFSLEPHLTTGTTFGGSSGPDLFTSAWRAFTELLRAEHLEFA